MYFLFFGGAGVLRQRLPDAVQEEGDLLDAVPLEVCLELFKQLGGHLKRHRPHIVLVHLRIFLQLLYIWLEAWQPATSFPSYCLSW